MKKVIVITGVSSGIGKAFLEIGPAILTDYIFIGLTRSKAHPSTHENIEYITTDITDSTSLQSTIAAIIKKHKRIDVLINNAGSGMRGSIEDTTLAEVNAQMKINLWPTLGLIQLVTPIMRKQKSGHIINISSLAATIDYPTIGYYGAIKAFIEKVTATLAHELKPWNIQVSLIIPGAVKTHFGKSMSNVAAYEQSPYEKLYKEWNGKFAQLFKNPTTSEDAARAIVETIKKPKENTFFRPSDSRDYFIRRVVGAHRYARYFLNKHMRG